METINKRIGHKVGLALCLRFVVFLLGISLPCSLLAQNVPSIRTEELGTDKTFSQYMTDCILPLDKSFITTGLLADMAFPYVSLTSFDGQTDTLVTFRQWKQMHRQMYLSQVSDTNALIVPEKLKQMTREFKNRGIIPIALMNLKYNRFKPYAIDSNLIVFSEGKFYDVPGRTESPYFEERLFAATVYQDKVYSGRVTFRIDDHFFLCNTMGSVSMVEIDFADGRGYRSYSMSNLLNNDVTVSYRQAGTKVITIRMTLSDQTVLQTKTRITLEIPPRMEPDEILEIIGQAYDGVAGKGKAYILYGCGNDRTLRKPIIVSDGFDPGNERGFYGLYEMLNKEQFIEKARAEGFDFVILDYDEGADYIQRNAFVMVSLIEEVNSRLKDSHPRLTIIGPSMGGLITRYALNYMEQHAMNHNTGLYVSFDSPHLGANIPLGDQHWLDFFATYNGNNEAVENRDKLNTPAAKQMLIYHHTQTNNNQANHHPLRTSFLADPYFNSWPTKCRKIAIANGSGVGTTLFAPSTKMIDWEWNLDTWFGSINLIKGNVWALPTQNDGEQKIFEGKVPYFFWGINNFLFYFEVGIANENVFIDGSLPYDGAPGGTYDVNKMIADADTDDHGDIETDYPDICFIPVISSLALNTNDVNYRVHDIPGYPFPSSNYTPFDAIYAPDDNQEHVEVTDEIIAWIMNEIGALDLYLQNQTVYEPTDFEARNSITTGREVMNHIPVGDFIVQNSEGKVELHSEGIIRLKEGTHLKPEEEGLVRLWISEFPCTSMFAMRGHPLRNNTSKETEFEEWNATSDSESVAQSVAEKLPRNHPNPCRGITTVEYELDGSARVEIEVYSLMGIRLMTVEDYLGAGAGRYATTLNTSSLPTGMYIVVVKANGVTNGVLKMQVVK